MRDGFGARGSGGGEFDAPEVGTGGQEFDADALAFLTDFTEIDDTNFLFFLCGGTVENQHGAILDRLIEIEQAAVSVNDDGLTGLAELASVGIFTGNPHADAHEDSRAAAGSGIGDFGHRETIVRLAAEGVNQSHGRVCLGNTCTKGPGAMGGTRGVTQEVACPSLAISVEWMC